MRRSLYQLSTTTLRTSFLPLPSQQAKHSISRARFSTDIQPPDATTIEVKDPSAILSQAEKEEAAKWRNDKYSSGWQGAITAPEGEPAFAFAFDIDGVLLRSRRPIRNAQRTLAYLVKHNIPFILLTNGGGKPESERVLELSSRLGIPLTEKNFVQSHTPFKELVDGSGEHDALKDKTILVTGADADKCRGIAELYGFKNVITPEDILYGDRKIWPFSRYNTRQSHRSLPKQSNPENPDKTLKFDAIFVFNDPRDWALDCQITMDLLMSEGGYLGTYSSKNGNQNLPNNGWQQDNQPKLYFSNPDLFWAASYHLPRFGQGAFQAALQGIWAATTGGATLERTVIGKPHAHTYEYAENVLHTYHSEMLQERGAKKTDQNTIQRVYMVGDNPESDIRGANQFKSPHGTEWKSILVKTGVYQDGTLPAHVPTHISGNVSDAVKWALMQEGYNFRPKIASLKMLPIEQPGQEKLAPLVEGSRGVNV